MKRCNITADRHAKPCAIAFLAVGTVEVIKHFFTSQIVNRGPSIRHTHFNLTIVAAKLYRYLARVAGITNGIIQQIFK
ncbi:Uncharacterised protein [Vibrio cholerae]|nr:Uncharacterised protein [Vibrio cholerae]